MKANFLKILPILLFLNACGAFKSNSPARSIASVGEHQEAIVQDVEDKLLQIHFYYVIAQKQLILFDKEIAATDLDKLYEKLKREDLLKDYNKTLTVAKDASTSETSLRIDLGSGKSYKLAAYGGYNDISKDEVYKSIQSIKYLLESFSKN